MTLLLDAVWARLSHRLARGDCHHPRWSVHPQVCFALTGALCTADGLKWDLYRDHQAGPKLRPERLFLKCRREFPRADFWQGRPRLGRPLGCNLWVARTPSDQQAVDFQ